MAIRLLVMDVDGTLTDGKIYMGNNGELLKTFNVRDGYGIHNILFSANIIPVVITGRESKIVENRCKELGICELYQGIGEKKAILEQIVLKGNYSYSEVAYIGDDINDIFCMFAVKEGGGFVGCPADAVKQVRDIADFISAKNGGDGAVREFIEWFMA